MTSLLAVAGLLLLFGYLLTKPPSQFSETPPRIGVLIDDNCKGELAVYSTIDSSGDIMMAVSAKATRPSDYTKTFVRLADQPETSAPYAPLSDELFCRDIQMAVVGPPGSSISPMGAVFGDVVVQNQTVGSYRREGIVETALSTEPPSNSVGNGDLTEQVIDPDVPRVGYISVADDPSLIQHVDLSNTDHFGRRGNLFGIADPDFESVLWDCVDAAESESETGLNLSQFPCINFVRSEPLPGYVAVASPTTSCSEPGGPETRQCVSKSSIAQKAIAPVALLFKIECPECKLGQRIGFTVDAIFTEMSTWLSGSERTVSLSAVAANNKTPAPWSDDDATRTKRYDNWISTTEVGAYSKTLDSYVWEPKNFNESRQFNLMWGAIVLGLGMTILIELLIVSIHPGIRLQMTPPDEDADPKV